MISCRLSAALGVMLAAFVAPAWASITAIRGEVRASVVALTGGLAGEFDESADTFPGTRDTLPLQVLAQLSTTEPDPAAAAAAAQFADPTTVSTPNPEEFALQLSLNSLDASLAYEGSATATETRDILFEAGELSLTSEDGQEVTVAGRVFVDGALAVYAASTDTDLSGAEVRIAIRVNQVDVGEVFAGSVALLGDGANNVRLSAGGSFPTNRLVLSNLSQLSPDFQTLYVLIIPRLQIPYSFTATVGTPLTLETNIEVTGKNLPDGVGIAGILGTPTDTLNQVIGLTVDFATAKQVVDGIQKERSNPTGDLAFARPIVLPGCGLFGVELLVGFVGLGGLIGSRRALPRRFGGKRA